MISRHIQFIIKMIAFTEGTPLENQFSETTSEYSSNIIVPNDKKDEFLTRFPGLLWRLENLFSFNCVRLTIGKSNIYAEFFFESEEK